METFVFAVDRWVGTAGLPTYAGWLRGAAIVEEAVYTFASAFFLWLAGMVGTCSLCGGSGGGCHERAAPHDASNLAKFFLRNVCSTQRKPFRREEGG